MDYISEPSKFPTSEHYAAIVFETIHQEGYDSRDPGTTVPICKYIRFKDKSELTKWVTDQETPSFGAPKKNYKIISSKPLPVTITVSVEV